MRSAAIQLGWDMHSLLRARVIGLASSWRHTPRLQLRLITLSARSTRGFLQVGDRRYQCVLGKRGTCRRKVEGDGATPAGVWPLRAVLYRADRVTRPPGRLTTIPIQPNDGWCDDASSRRYNRPVSRPCTVSHETLQRQDGIYDVIVVLGFNDNPVALGRGSAIFMHIARSDYSPTEGCLAFSRRDLFRILARLGQSTSVVVGSST